MQVHALKTFLNSTTRQLQHAGTDFEVEDAYAKDLERNGIVKLGAGAVPAATPQPQRNQAVDAAPSTVGKAPLTSASIAGKVPPSSSSPQAPASASKTVTTPAAPKRL